ncbi:hypothetical protein [Caulobacter sp. 17J80-11]|uniref:hypothetical protein n=1 Tax=Caulobacter sp. 17J80-11 TaxID=2763502 RepID=UPI00165365CC|nr:hypothetical protein [Caulobacter sp. 17J80-11]MBC6982541.1 hypothetical protein [Caulobacter sp. 17J80-11]
MADKRKDRTLRRPKAAGKPGMSGLATHLQPGGMTPGGGPGAGVGSIGTGGGSTDNRPSGDLKDRGE